MRTQTQSADTESLNIGIFQEILTLCLQCLCYVHSNRSYTLKQRSFSTGGMRPGVWRAHNQRQPLNWQGMNGRLSSTAEATDNQQRLSTLTGLHIQAGLPAPQNSNLQLLTPSDHMTWKQSQPPAIVGGLWRLPVVLAGPKGLPVNANSLESTRLQVGQLSLK